MSAPPADSTAPVPSVPLAARGVATGIGSIPGQDPREAAAIVAGELPELPHLPELPGRGPGADMVGRTAALLPGLSVDRQPSGWRLTSRAGLDVRRAASYLSHDLDALQEALDGYHGPVKVAVTGPWTLAASLQLPRGEPVLTDPGASRDVRQALLEGIGEHLQDVARRLPGCEVLLQLDEPGLTAVLEGRVPTFSGARTVQPVPANEVGSGLGDVVRACGELRVPVVVHCCAPDMPVALLRGAGVAGISLDLTVIDESPDTALDTALGEALEAGLVLFAGVVPPVDGPLSDAATTVGPVRRLWGRLGLAPETMVSDVVVTPACGMAGASPAHAVRAMRLARDAARALADG